MQKTFVFILLFMTIYSCQDKKASTKTGYKPLGLRRVNVSYSLYSSTVDGVTTGGHGYNHYVFVEGYNDEAWNNRLVEYADKYIDTCKTNLPIWSITFCKPFDFIHYGDTRATDALLEHAIIDISYSDKTLHSKYHDIDAITFFNDGKASYISLLRPEKEKEKNRNDSARTNK